MTKKVLNKDSLDLSAKRSLGDFPSQEGSLFISQDNLSQALLEIEDLMELGAYQEVYRICHKYNFFNSYLDLIIHFIKDGNFLKAEELLLEFLSGPLKQDFFLAVQKGNYDDFDELISALWLIDFYLVKLHNRCSRCLTSKVIEFYSRDLGFLRRIRRHQEKITLPNLKTEEYLSLLIVQYLVAAKIKLENKKNINITRLSVHLRGLSIKQALSLGEYELIEFLTNFQTDSKINDSLLDLAYQNMTKFLDGQQTSNYLVTEAKIDLETLLTGFDKQDVLDLAEEMDIYDFHPLITYQYYLDSNFTQAAKIFSKISNETYLFEKSLSFEWELLKENLRNLFILIFANLQEKRDGFLRDNYWILGLKEKIILHKLLNVKTLEVSSLISIESFEEVWKTTLLKSNQIFLTRRDKKRIEPRTFQEIFSELK